MHHLRRRRGYSHSCRIRQSGRGEAAGIKRSGLYGPLATDRWRDGNIGAHGEQVAQSGAVNRREKLRIFSLRIQIGKARSEEHTSELQSLMRISYAVFCLKKKKRSIKKY